MVISFLKVYLFERVTERRVERRERENYSIPLVQCWTKYKAGIRNFIWVTQEVGKGPNNWNMLCCFANILISMENWRIRSPRMGTGIHLNASFAKGFPAFLDLEFSFNIWRSRGHWIYIQTIADAWILILLIQFYEISWK